MDRDTVTRVDELTMALRAQLRVALEQCSPRLPWMAELLANLEPAA